MKPRREFVRVPGNPAVVASRAAARLAYLGDQVEPLSDSSFIWNPQPAERKLFRCPDAVVVTALPADEPGHVNVSFEWRRPLPFDVFLPAGIVLALAALVSGQVLGGPLWASLMAMIPGCLTAAAPTVLDSGWFGRLSQAVRVGRSRGLERVPEADQWLALPADEREFTIELLREAAESLRTSSDLRDLTYRGVDERSDETRDGWPLWHHTFGRDPVTDRPRLARAWRATGQMALGRVAIGQVAKGWLAIGQAAVGIVAIGQAAVGLVFALGQLGVSALASVAQLAVGLLAAGQMAIGLLSVDMGVPKEVATAVFLAATVAVVALAGLAARFRGLAAGSTRRKQAEAQLDEHRQGQPIPDEASISLAERLSGGDLERGLSLVTGDGEGDP